MFSINTSLLPSKALLAVYRDHQQYPGAFTDCYCTEISVSITQEQYISAFYTTTIFKWERSILKWLVAKPSSDEQAIRLAKGENDSFAAWNVEARNDNQLLMCDFQGRTRSWLMVEPLSDKQGTRLYFGSAVLPRTNKKTGVSTLGFSFYVLNGFHKLYSIALLLSAKKRLERIT